MTGQWKYALVLVASFAAVSACIDGHEVKQYVEISHKCVLSDEYKQYCHFRETLNFDDRRGQMFCIQPEQPYAAPVCYNKDVGRGQ